MRFLEVFNVGCKAESGELQALSKLPSSALVSVSVKPSEPWSWKERRLQRLKQDKPARIPLRCPRWHSAF